MVYMFSWKKKEIKEIIVFVEIQVLNFRTAIFGSDFHIGFRVGSAEALA